MDVRFTVREGVRWLVGALSFSVTFFALLQGTSEDSVFGYGFHDLQEAEVFPGLNAVALEPHAFFAKFGDAGDWMQTLFQGVLNVTPQITWLQLVMWAAYLVPVMFMFLRRPSAPKPARRCPLCSRRRSPRASPR